MEPLMEIPREKWPNLRDLYADDWPQGAAGFCILDYQISYPDLTEAFQFKVYSPEGDIANGMVAVIEEDGFYQVLIHPLNKNLSKIEDALRTTTLIDWNREICLPSCNTDVIASMERIKSDLEVNVNYDDKSKAFSKHVLRRNSSPFENLSYPANTYVGPLISEHVDIVDKTWTYHSPNTSSFFKILMKNNLTYVLYSSSDHQPLSWVTINEVGELTHLFCLEPYRKKGYAEFLIKFTANESLRRGHNVLAYTIEGNVKAQKLFDKLGFESIGFDYWVFVNKINK